MKESPEHIKARMEAALAVIQSISVACPECSVEFIRTQIGQRYCSTVCAKHVDARRSRRRHDLGRTANAVHATIGTTQSEEHKRKRAASTALTLATSRKDCRHCGEAFTPTQPAQVYCSGRCWNSAARSRRRNPPRAPVTPAEYAHLRETYGNRCQVCQAEGGSNARKDRLAVDHDHVTGELRGLLCHRCNTALGLLNDSPDLAHQAFRYLAYHGSVRKVAV